MTVNDLAFAGHAVVLSVLTYSQFFPKLWGFDKQGRERKGDKVSWGIRGFIIGCVAGVGVAALIVAASPREDVRTGWAWIDVVSLLVCSTLLCSSDVI